jgi:hypothetical protein
MNQVLPTVKSPKSCSEPKHPTQSGGGSRFVGSCGALCRQLWRTVATSYAMGGGSVGGVGGGMGGAGGIGGAGDRTGRGDMAGGGMRGGGSQVGAGGNGMGGGPAGCGGMGGGGGIDTQNR